MPDGGFIATNFQPRINDPAVRARLTNGETNGELWEWHAGGGWTKVPGSDASGANGLQMSADGRWLYVAEWGSRSFFRLSRGRTPVERQAVELGFRVDNVEWGPGGTLWAAGQGTNTTIVVEIDPGTLAVLEILSHPNDDVFGSGTVALRVGVEILVGSFRGDRIAVFPAERYRVDPEPSPLGSLRLPHPRGSDTIRFVSSRSRGARRTGDGHNEGSGCNSRAVAPL